MQDFPPKGVTNSDLTGTRGHTPNELVDVLAAWATTINYQQAQIPTWVRDAIDRAVSS